MNATSELQKINFGAMPTHRTMITIFRISRFSWFLGSTTNPSRVEKVQEQNREVQNTNCRKN
jgi:hypothetical protein